MADYGGSWGSSQPQDYYQASGNYGGSRPAISVGTGASSSGLGNIFNFLAAAGQLYSTYQATSLQKKIAEETTNASRLASRLNMESRSEEQAINTAKAASERRQQLREERVKRGKLMQSSVNSGVNYSSGTMGAGGALSTQLGSNLGFNAGMIDATSRISANKQEVSNIITENANQVRADTTEASMWQGIGGLSGSIFAGTGGFNSLFGNNKSWSQSPAPVENKSTKVT